MHDSHRFWIMASIFIIVIGLLIGMYLTATPDKMAPVIKKEMPEQTVNMANGRIIKNTIIVPYINAKPDNLNNIVYCMTFQFAWDELGAFMGGDPRLAGDPYTGEMLNKHYGGRGDIAEESYLAAVGFGRDGIAEQIAAALKEKFNDVSSFEMSLNPNDMLAYAYLYKNLRFKQAFENTDAIVFNGTKVKAFGFKDAAAVPELGVQAELVYYKNDDEFAVRLNSLSEKDNMILARIAPERSFAQTVEKVLELTEYAGKRNYTAGDNLSVPVINFDVLKNYADLTGRKFLNDGYGEEYEIFQALQAIKFKLDAEGAVLRSEAAIAASDGLAADKPAQKKLIFDKPFLLLLKEKGAKYPYFAVWFNNAELFETEE